MSTEVETETGDTFEQHEEDFLKYPLYKVVSVFENSGKLPEAVSELQANGFVTDDIEAFCGWQGRDTKLFEGSKSGVWDQFLHAVKHVGPERTYLERYEKHLKDGDCLIMVKVANKERKAKAAEILHTYTNERVTYFGLLAAGEVK